MSSNTPDEWLTSPPESLVVGDEPYAAALGAVLGTEAVHWDHLQLGPQADQDGRYPQVLQNLLRVLLVVPGSISTAQALRSHELIWRWVAKLAPDGDQHELAFLFVLPPNTSNGFEDALAAGLSLVRIVPATTGHAVWRRSASIQELIETLKSIHPMDLLAGLPTSSTRLLRSCVKQPHSGSSGRPVKRPGRSWRRFLVGNTCWMSFARPQAIKMATFCAAGSARL